MVAHGVQVNREYESLLCGIFELKLVSANGRVGWQCLTAFSVSPVEEIGDHSQ